MKHQLKTTDRYIDGAYNNCFGDSLFKATHLSGLITRFPSVSSSLRTYADVGCGDGSVFAALVSSLIKSNVKLTRAVGYDVSPVSPEGLDLPEFASLESADFLQGEAVYDLISLIDVVEHVTQPQEFIRAVASRARYLLLNIPLDDRLSVYMAQQWNYRLQDVGHLSFWNIASAITMLCESSAEPLWCELTPGFLAPSGRVRLLQKLALPLRWILWKVSPSLTSLTVGGVSLAVLCRGQVKL